MFPQRRERCCKWQITETKANNLINFNEIYYWHSHRKLFSFFPLNILSLVLNLDTKEPSSSELKVFSPKINANPSPFKVIAAKRKIKGEEEEMIISHSDINSYFSWVSEQKGETHKKNSESSCSCEGMKRRRRRRNPKKFLIWGRKVFRTRASS